MSDYQSKHYRRKIVDAYGAHVSHQIDEGWDAYLFTFMYTQLRGSSAVVLSQMFDEVERVYATLLTRIVRNPHSAASQGRLPRLIACPDFPVFKHRKHSLMDVVINDGQHVHGIFLVPPSSRLQATVDEQVAARRGLYLGRSGRLARIDVEPIKRRPAYVTDYALKAIKDGAVSLDDLLILPRTSGELRDRFAA